MFFEVFGLPMAVLDPGALSKALGISGAPFWKSIFLQRGAPEWKSTFVDMGAVVWEPLQGIFGSPSNGYCRISKGFIRDSV